ncbi:MAG: agmatinase [Thermodesulfovibrionales bacterium]
MVLPVPYEMTTSFGKGTSGAPEAIIGASQYLELYDEEIDAEVYERTEGIATLPSITFGEDCRDDAAVSEIRNAVSGIIRGGRKVILLGGEHTIAIGAVQAHAQLFGDLSVLQLDAHSDLRDEYEGNRFSHACTMARIYEACPRIVQLGIRSQCKEEADFIRRNGINTFYACDVRKGAHGPGESWCNTVIDRLTPNVYLTFDCDFLDPSVMPAVGTPEPGGFHWDETMCFLRKLAQERNIVGMDINELAPLPNLSHPQFTIAKLIYKLIGYISDREG